MQLREINVYELKKRERVTPEKEKRIKEINVVIRKFNSYTEQLENGNCTKCIRLTRDTIEALIRTNKDLVEKTQEL